MSSFSRRMPLWASAGMYCAALCVMRSEPASAQQSPQSYETQRVMQYLAGAGLGVDDAPEGKRIRKIFLERREVFEGDDLLVPVVLPSFAPTWPNLFHAVTTDPTIRRELVLHEDEPYLTPLAEESMRNLRALGVFGLVRIVAIRTTEPNTVDVLVYTRDLWSLRFEQEFSGAGKTFEVAAQLVERNFLGRDKSLAGRFSLAPDVYTVGQTYVDPRIAGESLALSEAFDVIVNRESGKPEGSTGGLTFSRPYYTLAQRFSFEITLAYAIFVWRDLRGGELLGYDTRAGAMHGKACAVGADECIPIVWDESRLRIDAAVHRRFGVNYTQTFSAGAGAYSLVTDDNRETGLRSAAERRTFEAEVLPGGRREVYPFLRYRLSLPRYEVFTNLGTYGLAESVQVGPSLDGSVYAPLKPLGSDANGLSFHGLAGYVWAGRDALLDVVTEGYSRLRDGRAIDQRAIFRVRGASPSFDWLWGRMVARFFWEARQNDTTNAIVTLGGENGLRGFAAQQFYARGANRVLWNVEYRTRPWVLQSIHFGLVAFYDAGSVYETAARLRVHHAIGAGVRALIPQLNRTVFGLDVGQPIGEPGFSMLLTYNSAQVVALTPGEDYAAQYKLGPSLK